MEKGMRGPAKRVLVIGTIDEHTLISPDAALAPDGMMIVMGHDAVRSGTSAKRTYISGDPGRMLYKLAGPFDAIFCSPAYLGLRPMLEKLLAPDGVLITNDQS